MIVNVGLHPGAAASPQTSWKTYITEAAAPGCSPTNSSWTFDSDWWVVTTLKKQAKMPLFKMTKWYFRPKWKINTSSDFLPTAKRQKNYSKGNYLIINKIQISQKLSKNRAGRNFLKFLNILIIYWLLIYYVCIYSFYFQTSPKIHPLLSFCSGTFSKQELYTS